MNARLRRRRDFLRPLVEMLEPRRLLTCDVFVQDRTLFILGDEADNRIELAASSRGLEVFCDDISAGNFPDIDDVTVRAGMGADEILFRWIDQFFGQGHIRKGDPGWLEGVDLGGGPGLDTFHVQASPAGHLTLHGDEDGDHYAVEFGRLSGAVSVADDGLQGQDVLDLLGTSSAERIELSGGNQDVWLVKWEGPDVNPGGNEVAIESIEIAHEGIELGVVDARGDDDQIAMHDPQGLLGGIDYTIDLGEGHNLFDAQLVNPDGMLDVAAGRGNDMLTITAAWDDQVGDNHPDFLWLPTCRTSAGNDQTLITVFTRSGSIASFPLPEIEVELDLAAGDDRAEILVAPGFPLDGFGVEIDTGAGSDAVEIDVAPAVTDLSVIVYAGRGNDTVDVQMSALPDELQVSGGEGDDDVSMVFAELPNVPSPPRDPGDPPPEIIVDVGSGVDAAFIDVFSTLVQPPSDVGEFVPQITLTEVLASIFITGVGQLALLTLFPLGALEMHQAIQDDRAGHAQTEATIAIDGANLDVDLATGATRDTVQVDLAPVPGSRVDLNLDSGRGDDELEVRSTSPAGQLDWTLDVIPGGGIDEVLVVFEHGDPDRPIIIGAVWNTVSAEGQRYVNDQNAKMTIAAAVETAEATLYSRVTGSTGHDEVQFDALLAPSTGDIEIDVDWKMGSGDDAVAVNIESVAPRVAQSVRIDLGAGADRATTANSDYPVSITPPDKNGLTVTNLVLLGGLGDDILDLTVEAVADQVEERLAIDSGAGDDEISVLLRRLANPHLPPGEQPPRREDLDIDLIAGTGDDAIALRSSVGAGRHAVRIDAGDGDNSMEAYYEATQAEIDDIDMYYAEEGPQSSSESEYDYGYESGDGDDSVKVVYAAALGLDLALTADTGSGDDSVDIALAPLATRSGTINPPPKDDPNQPPAETERFWTLALDAGAGHDAVALDASYPGDPCEFVADFGIATGLGNDSVAVNVESAVEQLAQKMRIDSGAGDDRVTMKAPRAQRDGLADLIVGAGPGAGPHVKAFDGGTQTEVQSFFAYDASFAGGVRVAAGDVNGDGVADVITGAGPGAGPHVKVFDGRTGAEVRSFFAYGMGFSGGVFVAAGDVNGDGRADIITGAGAGAAGGHVKVFDGRTGAEVRNFFALDPSFSGGVTVAGGDVNGDGRDDVIVGAGPGVAGGHVKVFDGGSLHELRSFFAYEPNFIGGAFVAAGDIDGDGRADVVTGADAGAPGGHVKAFSGASGAEIRSFFAYDAKSMGGVRVAAGDVNGDGMADIVTGAGPGIPGGHVKVFDGLTGSELTSFFAFEPNFAGGVFVAAGDLNSSATTRNLTFELDVDTGRGNDILLTDVISFEVQVLRQMIRLDLGDGADFVRTRLLEPVEFLDDIEFPRDVQSEWSIDTGDGNDRAEVELQPTAREGRYSYAYLLRMSGGNDIARYWVYGTELPPANPNRPPLGRLDLAIEGGAGHDDIQGRVGLARDGQLLPLMLTEARLAIDGGGGRDRLSLDFRGAILDPAAVDLILLGGAGDDQVRARVDLDPASTGQLSVQVLGDDGNDELGLAVLNADNLKLLVALLDGGWGKDRCRTTPNVTVVNCP